MEKTEKKIAIENLEICWEGIDKVLRNIEEDKNYEVILDQIFNLRELLKISEINLRHIHAEHIFESLENGSYKH